jgi:hypothetical protein
MDKKKLIYYNPGDLVQIKHNLPNKPPMVVSNVQKARSIPGGDESSTLLGIKCFWFTKDFLYQEQNFNTKDLEHLDPAKRDQSN